MIIFNISVGHICSKNMQLTFASDTPYKVVLRKDIVVSYEKMDNR